MTDHQGLSHQQLYDAVRAADPDAVDTIASAFDILQSAAYTLADDLGRDLAVIAGALQGQAGLAFQESVENVPTYTRALAGDLASVYHQLKHVVPAIRKAQQDMPDPAGTDDHDKLWMMVGVGTAVATLNPVTTVVGEVAGYLWDKHEASSPTSVAVEVANQLGDAQEIAEKSIRPLGSELTLPGTIGIGPDSGSRPSIPWPTPGADTAPADSHSAPPADGVRPSLETPPRGGLAADSSPTPFRTDPADDTATTTGTQPSGPLSSGGTAALAGAAGAVGGVGAAFLTRDPVPHSTGAGRSDQRGLFDTGPSQRGSPLTGANGLTGIPTTGRPPAGGGNSGAGNSGAGDSGQQPSGVPPRKAGGSSPAAAGMHPPMGTGIAPNRTGQNDQPGTTTWLTEDQMDWEAGTDAPPPVLGRGH